MRFRNVLIAAQKTPRYCGALQTAGLGTVDAVGNVSSIEAALSGLPRVEFAERTGWEPSFRNALATPVTPNRLFFPIAPTPRCAVFLPRFEETARVKVFDPKQVLRLVQFQPEAIAGNVHFLASLAELVDRGRLELPSLKRGLIAFTGIGSGAAEGSLLDERTRNLLWRVFRVPVFEQYIGFDGRLIAWECEAHDGLHMVEENAVIERDIRAELLLTSLTDRYRPTIRVATRMTASLEDGACGCGKAGRRLVLMRPVSSIERKRVAMAG
ncbi:MAG: hypothetical protein ACRD8O_14670 [Bryobacteraceae bacterium]